MWIRTKAEGSHHLPPPSRRGAASYLPRFAREELWRKWTRRPVSRVLCRPGRNLDIGDHSSGPPLAGRFSRPTRTAQAYDSPTPIAEGARSLFGLAPGGACHAVPVTRHAVGSYPTLSPLPLRRAEVCFLWRYPWGRPRRALPAAMSSWSPDFPRPSCESRDRPAVWSARNLRVQAREVKQRAGPPPGGKRRPGGYVNAVRGAWRPSSGGDAGAFPGGAGGGPGRGSGGRRASARGGRCGGRRRACGAPASR